MCSLREAGSEDNGEEQVGSGLDVFRLIMTIGLTFEVNGWTTLSPGTKNGAFTSLTVAASARVMKEFARM